MTGYQQWTAPYWNPIPVVHTQELFKRLVNVTSMICSVCVVFLPTPAPWVLRASRHSRIWCPKLSYCQSGCLVSSTEEFKLFGGITTRWILEYESDIMITKKKQNFLRYYSNSQSIDQRKNQKQIRNVCKLMSSTVCFCVNFIKTAGVKAPSQSCSCLYVHLSKYWSILLLNDL